MDGSVVDAQEPADGGEIAVNVVREMDIYGNDNTITVRTAREINVYGNNNIVTFASGNPDIDDEGSGNTISAG